VIWTGSVTIRGCDATPSARKTARPPCRLVRPARPPTRTTSTGLACDFGGQFGRGRHRPPLRSTAPERKAGSGVGRYPLSAKSREGVAPDCQQRAASAPRRRFPRASAEASGRVEKQHVQAMITVSRRLVKNLGDRAGFARKRAARCALGNGLVRYGVPRGAAVRRIRLGRD